jgi:hypothetical protein
MSKKAILEWTFWDLLRIEIDKNLLSSSLCKQRFSGKIVEMKKDTLFGKNIEARIGN